MEVSSLLDGTMINDYQLRYRMTFKVTREKRFGDSTASALELVSIVRTHTRIHSPEIGFAVHLLR